MSGYTLDCEHVALPAGAWARTRRRLLRVDGRVVLGLTGGIHRPYLFPVYTPAGFAVTAESPADHPHHHSLWIGADHVHLAMPAHEGRDEIYAYNCYVNDVFQGRAPGRIVETAASGAPHGAGFRIAQTIEWRGPLEWGAPEGRLLVAESRTVAVHRAGSAYLVDVESRLAAPTHRITLGPTRHAYFNFRVAPSLAVESGGVLQDDRGNRGAAASIDVRARWIAAVGPVGGGHHAGVALAPRAGRDWWWFVSDWGVATASPCRDRGIELAPGAAPVVIAARFAVFDGAPESAQLGAWLDE